MVVNADDSNSAQEDGHKFCYQWYVFVLCISQFWQHLKTNLGPKITEHCDS